MVTSMGFLANTVHQSRAGGKFWANDYPQAFSRGDTAPTASPLAHVVRSILSGCEGVTLGAVVIFPRLTDFTGKAAASRYRIAPREPR